MILTDLADLKKVVPTKEETPGDDPMEGFEVIGTLPPEMAALHVLVIRAFEQKRAAEDELDKFQGRTVPEELNVRVGLSRSLFDSYRMLFQHTLFEKFGKKVAGRPVQVCREWKVAMGKSIIPQVFFAVEVVANKDSTQSDQWFPFKQKRGEA